MENNKSKIEININKVNFIGWFPRLSVIMFVLILFTFLSSDISRFLANAPLFFNFFFGIIIISALIISWNRNKLAGIIFIVLGILYGLGSWDKILAVSTISTSFWLILTGFLFFVAEKENLHLREEALQTEGSLKIKKPSFQAKVPAFQAKDFTPKKVRK